MATIRRIEDIQAWQKARELVRDIYKTSAAGSFSKDFGLKDQICRAAVSCMSNVAEGFARKSDRDFARFLDMARGSAIEVQSLLYVASDVGYIGRGDFQKLYRMADETISLISGFTAYLRKASRLRTPDSGPRPPRRMTHETNYVLVPFRSRRSRTIPDAARAGARRGEFSRPA